MVGYKMGMIISKCKILNIREEGMVIIILVIFIKYLKW